MLTKKRIITAIGLLALSSAAFADSTITNNTNFYLNSKSDSPNPACPTQIAPGQTVTAPAGTWCGYVACATSQFNSVQGCLENAYPPSPTPILPPIMQVEGGYATWFSISFSSPSTCNVPATNTYQCHIDNNNGFTMDYNSIDQAYSAGPSSGQVVQLPKNISAYQGIAFRGINISGLEYDGTFLDAIFQHPDIPDAKYFAEQGMNTIRLPIRWEFVMGTAGNIVNSTDPNSTTMNNMYLASVYDTVEKYLKNGMTVDLDLHNYMRFCQTGTGPGQRNEPTDLVNGRCQIVTSSLASVWQKILSTQIVLKKGDQSRTVTFADLAKKYPQNLILGLMNEPYSNEDVPNQKIKTVDVFNSELQTIQTIRSLGVTNLILISGNYWDPLHGWATFSPFSDDQPNGVVFSQVFTPAVKSTLGNIAVEAHQYFDYNYSGIHEQCNTYANYADFKKSLDLDGVSTWIQANGVKMFLSEFGAANSDVCKQDLNYMMQFLNENAYDASQPGKGGFIGWTVWRANRHSNGSTVSFSPFNFLQAGDYNVYGGDGTPKTDGTGILLGDGNPLMDNLFANYLTKPTSRNK